MEGQQRTKEAIVERAKIRQGEASKEQPIREAPKEELHKPTLVGK